MGDRDGRVEGRWEGMMGEGGGGWVEWLDEGGGVVLLDEGVVEGVVGW